MIASPLFSSACQVWDAYKGVQNIFGYVWTFLLQDILQVGLAGCLCCEGRAEEYRRCVLPLPLQFDVDTDQALSRIATANRTCRCVGL